MLPLPCGFRGRALCLSALLVFNCTTQAANVLIVNDNTYGGGNAIAQTNATANLEAVCFPTDTVTVAQDAVPADLSAYDQIWDLRFITTTLPAADQTAYTTYLRSGKPLFLLGEDQASNYATGRNSAIVNFVGALGGGALTLITNVSAAFNNNGSQTAQTVESPYDTTPNAISTVTFLNSGGVTTPGAGNWIAYDDVTNLGGSAVVWPTGTLTNTPAGSLTVVFDATFMLPTSTGGNNPQFLQNLCATVAAKGYPVLPGVVLSEKVTTRAIGSTHTVQAVVLDDSGVPQAGTTVTFTVTSGPNAGVTGTGVTDSDGIATFSYPGTAAGTDVIEASILGDTVKSNTVDLLWTTALGAAASVPALDAAGLALAGVLLGGFGLGAVRRRRGQ